MQIHGSQIFIGKLIRAGRLRMMNIDMMKGITHAQPVTVRPKNGNSTTEATKVEITTIQTIKGIFHLFIPRKLKLIFFILEE